jgi:hypothetical protein
MATTRVLAGIATGVAVAHAVPAVAALGPLRRRFLPALAGVGDPRHVALTFDDGPHPDATPRFLRRLEAEGVRATFFLLGSQIVRYPTSDALSSRWPRDRRARVRSSATAPAQPARRGRRHGPRDARHRRHHRHDPPMVAPTVRRRLHRLDVRSSAPRPHSCPVDLLGTRLERDRHRRLRPSHDTAPAVRRWHHPCCTTATTQPARGPGTPL